MDQEQKEDKQKIDKKTLLLWAIIAVLVVVLGVTVVLGMRASEEGKKNELAYTDLIKELSYDEELLQEAVVFKDVSKQANRIKCAMIGFNGLLELLDSLKAGELNAK